MQIKWYHRADIMNRVLLILEKLKPPFYFTVTVLHAYVTHLGSWNYIKKMVNWKLFLRLNWIFKKMILFDTFESINYKFMKIYCPGTIRYCCDLQQMYTLNSFSGQEELKTFIPRETLIFPLCIFYSVHDRYYKLFTANIKSDL